MHVHKSTQKLKLFIYEIKYAIPHDGTNTQNAHKILQSLCLEGI